MFDTIYNDVAVKNNLADRWNDLKRRNISPTEGTSPCKSELGKTGSTDSWKE